MRISLRSFGIAAAAYAAGLLTAFLLPQTTSSNDVAALATEEAPLEMPTVFVTATPPVEDLAPAKHRPAIQQTVAIDATLPDGVHSGSGLVLRDGLVLTSAHIAENADDPSAVPYTVTCGGDGEGVQATLAAFDVVRDVMFLRAECPGHSIPLRQTPIIVNEPLAAVGYEYWGLTRPRSKFYRSAALSQGAVLDISNPKTDPEVRQRVQLMQERHIPPFLAIGAPFSKGNSGGPVLDASGALVGIFAVVQPDYGRGWIVPGESIAAVMKEHGL